MGSGFSLFGLKKRPVQVGFVLVHTRELELTISPIIGTEKGAKKIMRSVEFQSDTTTNN